jgi:hypothetical protein
MLCQTRFLDRAAASDLVGKSGGGDLEHARFGTAYTRIGKDRLGDRRCSCDREDVAKWLRAWKAAGPKVVLNTPNTRQKRGCPPRLIHLDDDAAAVDEDAAEHAAHRHPVEKPVVQRHTEHADACGVERLENPSRRRPENLPFDGTSPFGDRPVELLS